MSTRKIYPEETKEKRKEKNPGYKLGKGKKKKTKK